MKTTRELRHLLPAALLVLCAAIFTCAQTAKTNTRPEQPAASSASTIDPKTASDGAKYFYEFNQPEFYLRHVEIEHDSLGKGRIKFERLNETVPVEETVELSPAARARILGLFQSLQFLDSSAEYQSEKQFPHLGTIRIRAEQGDKKRTVEFNWSSNRDAAALAAEYRKITDQAVFVFDISVARENQPLNAPKLLEGLESMIKRDGISDPKQLLPLLKEISADHHIPLIARNHATRLIKKIESAK